MKTLCKLLCLWAIILPSCGNPKLAVNHTNISNQYDTIVDIRHDTVVARYYYASNKWSNKIDIAKESLLGNNDRLLTHTRFHYELFGEESDTIVGCLITVERSDSLFKQDRLMMTIDFATNNQKDTTFVFDNHEIKVFVNQNEQDWIPIHINKYSYNLNGLLVSEKENVFYDNSGSKITSITKYKYNTDSKLIKAKCIFGAYGSSKNKVKKNYTYDNHGKVLSVAENGKDIINGKYTNKKRFEYDNQGNCIREFSNSYLLYEYEYNDTGKITRKISTPNYTTKILEIYEYDSAGRVSKETSTINDTLCWISTYQYNEAGRLLTKTFINDFNNNQPTSYERRINEYDHSGRLEKKVVTYYSNGIQNSNRITYYNYNEKNGSVSIEEFIQFKEDIIQQTLFMYRSSVTP